jgi:hypothetical protein
MILQEFEDIRSRTEFVYAEIGTDQVPNDAGANGHGTMMLGKVAGKIYDVAKRISPVVVRVGGSRSPHCYLDGVSSAVNHFMVLKAQGRLEKAVISMSWGVEPSEVSPGWIAVFRNLLQAMVNQGMFPVVSAGNSGEVSIPLPQYSLSFLTGF